jgi:hypothetical protein
MYDLKKFFLFKISLLFILIGLISLSVMAETVIPPPEKNVFKVAILGDRTGGNAEGLKILERAVYEINQLDPDFVIHIGDKVQGYTWDQDEWIREADEFKSYMGKLVVPWYSAAGNHDVTNPFRDPKDRTYEELSKKYFGPLNYSFDYKNSHFVIMYTDEAMKSAPTISDNQLQWLKTDLENTNKTNTFIFMHKPIWVYENSNWDKFHELIKKFPVKAVIAGHFHAYSKYFNKDGIQYYTVGPAGAEAYSSGDPLTGYFHHYSILSVDGDKFSMAIVKVGNVESDDYVLSQDYDNIWKITQLSPEKTGASGWLWQPVLKPVSGKVELHVNNPLDSNIHVQVRLSEKKSTWQMQPKILELDVPAKSNNKSEITLSSRKAKSEDIIPPELEFVYNYVNSKGQHVPVIVKNRVLLRDTANIQVSNENIKLDGFKNEIVWSKSSLLYNYTWVYSVYEKPDKPPKVYLTEDTKYLYFFAEVMDNKYAYMKPEKYNKGILSDAIVFSTMIKDKRQDIVIFPFNDIKSAFLAKDTKFVPSEMTTITDVDYAVKTDQKEGYYYCEGKIPLKTLFNDGLMKSVPFNVGVVDNDQEAFIYLRSWAYDRDPKYWGILNIGNKLR